MLINLYKKNINTQFNLKSKGTPAKPLLPNCDTVSFGNSKPTSFESLSPIYKALMNNKILKKEDERALLIEYHANCEPFRIVTRYQETLQKIRDIGEPFNVETRKVAKLKKLQAILAQLKTELPATETPEAKEKIKRAEKALKKLIEYNMQFVYAEAAKIYQKRNLKCLDINDLMAYGIKHLIKAIDMFDLEQNDVKLSTFVFNEVKGGIIRGIYHDEKVIRINHHLEELSAKVRMTKENLHNELSRVPSVIEIAKEMLQNNLKAQKTTLNPSDFEKELIKIVSSIKQLTENMPFIQSLEENVSKGEDYFTIADFKPDNSISPPHESLNDGIKERMINDLLNQLSQNERLVLNLRFGFKDGIPRNYVDIGKELKLTRQRIAKIEQSALKRLQHPSRRRILKEFV